MNGYVLINPLVKIFLLATQKSIYWFALSHSVEYGAIILLHTVSNNNVEALPIIIDEIRNNGYEICS